MRLDLSQQFLDNLSKQGRFPAQLLAFHFSDSETVYVTDCKQITSTSEIYYIVESWGTIAAVTDIELYLKGLSTPTKTASVTLLNMGNKPFSEYFFSNTPENVLVDYYQGFFDSESSIVNFSERDVPNNFALIDSLIIQDPISYNEASLLITLDLVSVNQYADPYVGAYSHVTNDHTPIVIGSVDRAPGFLYGNHPIATLLTDTNGGSGIPLYDVECEEDLVAAGFPTAGAIIIDYELIPYDGITGNVFHITGRASTGGSAAFIHSAGATVLIPTHEYLFYFVQGPVDFAGPLYVNGLIYTNSHTIYANRDPVQVGFIGELPFERGVSNEDYTLNQVFNVKSYTGDWKFPPATDNLITCDQASVQNNDVYYQFGQSNQDIVGSITGSFSLPSSVTGYSAFKRGEFYINIACTSYDLGSNKYQVTAARFNQPSGVTHTVIAGDFSGVGLIWGDYTYDIKEFNEYIGDWYIYIEYTVSTSAISVTTAGRTDCVGALLVVNGYTKEVTTDVTMDISTGTGVTNPAEAIKLIFAKIGVSQYIDSISFDYVYSWFADNNYFFEGYIPGNYRCREVITQMCSMSRCNIHYSAGLIKIYIRHVIDNKDPIVYIGSDKLRAGSVKVSHQRISDIVNRLFVRYAPDTPNGDFQLTYEIENAKSIAEYGLYEQVLDAYLITSPAMAQSISDFWILEAARPYVMLTFQTYISFFPYELDDTVNIETDFANIGDFTGSVVNIIRRVASAKMNQINLFEVSIYSPLGSKFTTRFIEDFTMSDSLEIDAGRRIERIELLALTDHVQIIAGYGTGGYGHINYGG